MSSRRLMRLNELLRRDVSARLLSEVKDPRVGFVTVLRAEIYSDYTRADIFVSVLEDDMTASTIKALNRMKGFFQKDLSKTLGIRLTPILNFKTDIGVKHSVKLDTLINLARQTDSDHQEGFEAEEGFDDEEDDLNVSAKQNDSDDDGGEEPLS